MLRISYTSGVVVAELGGSVTAPYPGMTFELLLVVNKVVGREERVKDDRGRLPVIGLRGVLPGRDITELLDGGTTRPVLVSGVPLGGTDVGGSAVTVIVSVMYGVASGLEELEGDNGELCGAVKELNGGVAVDVGGAMEVIFDVVNGLPGVEEVPPVGMLNGGLEVVDNKGVPGPDDSGAELVGRGTGTEVPFEGVTRLLGVKEEMKLDTLAVISSVHVEVLLSGDSGTDDVGM